MTWRLVYCLCLRPVSINRTTVVQQSHNSCTTNGNTIVRLWRNNLIIAQLNFCCATAVVEIEKNLSLQQLYDFRATVARQICIIFHWKQLHNKRTTTFIDFDCSHSAKCTYIFQTKIDTNRYEQNNMDTALASKEYSWGGVQKYPILYNKFSIEFKDKHKKINAWKIVDSVFGLFG